MKRNTMISMAVALMAALGAGSAARAQAVPGYSCVGSAGAVDESGLEIFAIEGATLTVRDGGPALKRLSVIYPIAPSESLASPAVAGALEMAARVKDPGKGSFVKLWLVEVDLQTGETTNKLAIDSDQAEASNQSQELLASECDQQIAGWAFDFERNAYYVRAVLGQHNGGAAPELHHIQLRWQSSCP